MVLDILFYIGFVGVVWFYVIFRKRRKLAKICKDMPSDVSDLGYIIGVSGAKGVGKSTSVGGLCQYLTTYIIQTIQKRMNEIRICLPSIDFNELEKELDCIVAMMAEGDHDIISFIDYYIDRYVDSSTYYTDFLCIQDKKQMVFDYMYYDWIIRYRKAYVYSESYFYNLITNENGKLFDASSEEIRNVIDNKNFQGDIGIIKVVDEASIHNGNAFSNDKSTKLSGTKDSDALIRNAGLGITFKIVITQKQSDYTKGSRDQIDCPMYLYHRQVIVSFSFIRKLLDFYLKASFLKYKVWLKMKAIFTRQSYILLLEKWQKRDTQFRNKEYKISQYQKMLFSKGYIKAYFAQYYDVDDVGKKDSSLWEKKVLFFPIPYCYSSVRTHEYKGLIQRFKQDYSRNQVDDLVSQLDSNNRIDLFIQNLMKRKKDD